MFLTLASEKSAPEFIIKQPEKYHSLLQTLDSGQAAELDTTNDTWNRPVRRSRTDANQ
jgi:hypothetical protein